MKMKQAQCPEMKFELGSATGTTVIASISLVVAVLGEAPMVRKERQVLVWR